MKITAFYGSSKKSGNSSRIVDSILKGAETKGHSTEKVYLYYQKIHGCLGCQENVHESERCIHNDDMKNKLVDKIIASDVIIISSPIFFGQITGVLKTFIDRWCTFIDKGFEIRDLPEKKYITVITSGAENDTYINVIEYLDKWLHGFFKLDKVDHILAGNLMNDDDILKHPGILERAEELGKSL